ncbi:MAG: anhydro-N-acetylmuramic acid kinase, partial [Planctomycetes bacterium]|nr:anhydro-N-acetylmuramic acid kinase [Planctomycetota bacterium]
MDPSALRAKLESEEGLIVAGLLSGTSADGIDVGLARFRRKGSPVETLVPELLAFQTVPFDPSLLGRLRPALDGAALSMGEVGRLHRDLGLAFGSAAELVARKEGLRLD